MFSPPQLHHELHPCQILLFAMGGARALLSPPSPIQVSNWGERKQAPSLTAEFICIVCTSNARVSLVPRPHPLTRRNGLVKQVEFLGLAHTFATCNLTTIKTFFGQPAQKGYGCSNGDEQILLL